MKLHVHFVGFRDDRWWNAIKVFGKPDFVHPAWDRRAQREIAVNDTVVFATGEHDQPIVEYNTTDYVEEEPSYDRPNLKDRDRKIPELLRIYD